MVSYLQFRKISINNKDDHLYVKFKKISTSERMISHLKFRKILKSERNGYLQKLEKISTANKDDHLQLKFREISASKRKFHISKNFDKQ